MMRVFFLFLFAASTLERGEQLFLENKPAEALPLFEQALLENPQDEKVYLYLGTVYEQLQDPRKAIQVLRRGLDIAQRNKDMFYYNMGNNFLRLKELNLASEMYTKTLETNQRFEDAYLNRAQARLQLERLEEAREDYISYLRLAPDSPQREPIEKLIQLLGGTLEAQQRKQQDEVDKQKALLNEVLNSLKNAPETTRNLSAGSEEIEEKYEEIDINN